MTIEHKTTHGPHAAGQLAADWMLESGHVTRAVGPRTEVGTGIRLAVPNHDQDLSLESATALKDALVVHLRNMGWDDPDTQPEALFPPPPATPAMPWDRPESTGGAHPARAVHGAIFNAHQVVNAPADVVKVAESIRDAYADNSRTIGAKDVGGMTEAEAYGVGELRTGPHGCLVDAQGILYTDSAAVELRVKAGRHAAKLADRNAEEFGLPSPVEAGKGDVYRNAVRRWTDDQCRGAWNHAMEDTPKPGRLTDRPSGREYSQLAAARLRDRLNEINGADAPRG